MPRDDQPTLWELDRRVTELAKEMVDLRELVDGHEPWTHRMRLHAIEDNSRAAELAAQALDAFRSAERRVQTSRWRTARDWIAVAAAVAAVAVAVVALLHGTHVVHVPAGGRR